MTFDETQYTSNTSRVFSDSQEILEKSLDIYGTFLESAKQHIKRLTGAADTPVTLVAIRAKTPTDKAFIIAKHGVIDELAQWVTDQQKKGAGVYVTVNKTDGEKRTKTDIKEIRAIWNDDDIPRDSLRTEWPLPPHLVLETSVGKYHYYWLTHAQPGDEFDGVMQRMVTDHGCDKNAKDSARVLRLAGTFNLKKPDAPFQVRIVSEDKKEPYAWSEIKTAFPPACDIEGEISKPKLDVSDALLTLQTGALGMHDALLKLAARYAAKGLEEDECEHLLRSQVLAGDGAGRTDRLAQIPELVKTAFKKYAAGDFTDVETGVELDPVDMFSTHPAPTEFAPTDYPPAIAALATDIALRMGCDPKIPAWSALTACAAMVPDTFKLRPKAHDHTWSESARIWAALVGTPSSKKSPPMAAVLAPVHAVQKQAYATFQQRLSEWELRAADAKKDKLPEPKKPTLARIMVGDATTEALVSVCRENTDGVLVVHDELTGFFGSMDAYRQNGATKDRSLWLQTYNGGPFMVDRAGKGPTFVPNLSASMLGGIQPDPMRRIASKLDDDGLLQRYIVLPVASATDGLDRAPDAAAMQAWRDLVLELSALRGDAMSEWPSTFRLSADAQKAVDAARAKITAMARNPGVDSRLASALAKGEGQLIRLILTFHIIEDRTGESVWDDERCPSECVSLTTVNRVTRLYFNLIVPSMHAFYGDLIGVSPTHEHARWVAGFILASGAEKVTERDISRAYRSLRGDNAKREIADCMQLLELASWVSPIERRGKAPNTWGVNAAVHFKFADRARAERERRDHERAEISRLAKINETA